MDHKFIDIGSQKIHYLEGGNGKTVIVMPSLWRTSRSFKRMGKVLAKKFHVIIPDLYKGKSEFKKNAQSFDDYCGAFNEFIEKLQVNEVNLVGISYSGFFTSYFVKKYPIKISNLVLFSTTSRPIHNPHPLILAIKGSMRAFLYNFTSLRGIFLNFYWLLDAITYFLRHPSAFMGELSLAFKFHKSLDRSYLPVHTNLFIAEKDEYMDVERVKAANSVDKNLIMEVVHDRHAWFFYKPEKFLEMISNSIT